MPRNDRRQRGKTVAASIGLALQAEAVPGFNDFMAEVVYSGIWDRPGLHKYDRAICTLAALSVLQRLPAIEAITVAALELGLSPRNMTVLTRQGRGRDQTRAGQSVMPELPLRVKPAEQRPDHDPAQHQHS